MQTYPESHGEWIRGVEDGLAAKERDPDEFGFGGWAVMAQGVNWFSLTDFLPIVLDPEDAARSHGRMLEVAPILKAADREGDATRATPASRPSTGRDIGSASCHARGTGQVCP